MEDRIDFILNRMLHTLFELFDSMKNCLFSTVVVILGDIWVGLGCLPSVTILTGANKL